MDVRAINLSRLPPIKKKLLKKFLNQHDGASVICNKYPEPLKYNKPT